MHVKKLIIIRAAIYFDGSLPASKKEVRHRRLCERSGEAHRYFLKTISGIKADGGVPKRFLPEAPFLVPAILEALLSHKTYGRLTFLVPGEADPYCAEDVKQNGGTLLTSDSDLLLYDLGTAGSVVFLRDVHLHTRDATDAAEGAKTAEGGTSISALTYKQSELCRRMSLEPGQLDMLRLGFEMKMRPCHHVQDLPARLNWAYLDEAHAKEFAVFVAEYQGDLHGAALDYKDFLDPRISEFILDWAKANTSGGSESTVTVWLPSLVDRWDQASAWDLSTTIRQLAYSLLQDGQSSKNTVTEYRRSLSVRSAGQPVELLDRPEVSGAIDGLVDYVDRFLKGATVAPKLQWITMCLSLEISHAAHENKDSNTLGLWRKAAKSEGRLPLGGWDAVHLVAQILGILYSFRMMQQVLKVWTRSLLRCVLSGDQMNRLEECLSSLPTIAELPAAADMSDIFEQLHRAGQLDVLSEATGVPGIAFEANGNAMQSSRVRQKKVKGQVQQHPIAKSSQSPASANPFEALSMGN